MQPADLLQYQDQIKTYCENMKLTDGFEELTKQLILHRPEDPIAFLIDHLKNLRRYRIIIIEGLDNDYRNYIASSLGGIMNLNFIQLDKILRQEFQVEDHKLIPDERVYPVLQKELDKLSPHCRGVILTGFPNNLNQCIYLQQKGIIPERYFKLKYSDQQLIEHYTDIAKQNKTASEEERKELIQLCLISERVWGKDLSLLLTKQQVEFDTEKLTKTDVQSSIKDVLGVRDKLNIPLRALRILVIRPQGLHDKVAPVVNMVAQNFGLVPIFTNKLLQQQIDKKSEVGKYINQCFVEKKELPNDIVQSIVYTETQNTYTKQKGYIAENFPRNISQVNSLISMKFLPNLIVIYRDFDQEEPKVIHQSVKFIMLSIKRNLKIW